MRVFITEADRQNAYSIALINLARFYNIANYETIPLQKLVDILKNYDTYPLLKKYLEAYDEWFNFYKKIRKLEEETEKEHDLTEAERNELAVLIQKREDALNALQKKFDELQFEKFKRENGLENVNGIIL